MPPPKAPSLRSIIQRRKLPGMLLIDARGKLLFWNSVARQVLHRPNDREQLLRKTGNALRKVKKTRVRTSVDSPPCLILQTTFSLRRRSYALRAFLLDHQPKGRDLIVGVLLEHVSRDRLDLRSAQRAFGLSPREIEAIQVLVFGGKDKEIASTLEVRHETARGYLKAIRAKLGVSTRVGILHKLLSV